jgi:alpha-acetolactate decarboxylase
MYEAEHYLRMLKQIKELLDKGNFGLATDMLNTEIIALEIMLQAKE